MAERWQAALTRIVERHGEAFHGTDLDPAGIRQRMEKLVAASSRSCRTSRKPAPNLSATELLAARLRSALASNAIGGGRSNEDAKWRAAADAVRDAQTAWQRLGPLAGPEARALEARFRDACRRVMEHSRRHAQPQQSRRPTKPSTPERVGA